jgi:hypothetical protein
MAALLFIRNLSAQEAETEALGISRSAQTAHVAPIAWYNSGHPFMVGTAASPLHVSLRSFAFALPLPVRFPALPTVPGEP